ncbi:MAG: hypothetical protein KAG66_22315, partial [Methylococcales bacterium]|nr:hypothetical protein [Methylococcales bacterium]
MNLVFGYVDGIGRRAYDAGTYFYRAIMMVYLSIRAAMVDQAQGLRAIFSVVSAQIYFTGWQAMPLVTILALA